MPKRIGANRRQKMTAKRTGRRGNKAAVKAVGVLAVVSLVGFSFAVAARKAAHWASRAEILKVNKVAICGAVQVDSVQAVALAGVQPGISLFDVKTSEIRQRLSRNVWVSRATVQRLLPGKVTIRITERKPVAMVNMGEVLLVDEEGVLLPLPTGLCSDIPVLSGLRDTIAADSLRRLDAASLRRMRGLFETLGNLKIPSAKRVCQVRFDEGSRLALKLEGSRVVIACEEERLGDSLKRFERVMRLADSRTESPAYVNLCYGNRAYIR